MKKNILILLMLSITLTISAKPGKIKYGKFLIYEGEVVDKQPSGAGTLKAIEPKNKKEYAFTIEGVFNGSAVTNPQIKSQNGMPEMNVEGVVVVKTKGEKGKVESHVVYRRKRNRCFIGGLENIHAYRTGYAENYYESHQERKDIRGWLETY